MRLQPLLPNPAGAFDALFALVADAGGGDAASLPPELRASRSGSSRLLRILHFNDLHHYLHGVEGSDDDAHILSRIVRLRRDRLAAAAPDEVVLLLSGGDDHTGTPFDELLGWSAGEFRTDPAYVAYSAAGVDVAALGNHDLDRGGAVLAEGIRQCAAFPILSANVRGAGALRLGREYHPAVIAVAKGLRIGFIGLTTPIDTRVGTPSDPELKVASPLATLAALLPGLAAIVDVVVVMSHCGYGTDDRSGASPFGAGYLAEGDIALARRAAGLTERPVLIVGGHTHTVLNAGGLTADTLIAGIPILQAGGQGSHLGEFQARVPLAASRNEWSVSAALHTLTGAARGPSSGAPHPALLARDPHFEESVLAPLAAKVQARTAEVLAKVDWSPALSRDTTLLQRYAGECALANFICDALVRRSREFPGGPVDFAMVNSTAIGDGIAQRPTLTFRDWFRVQPFADTLQVATINGAQLLDILRSNARRILREEELRGPAPIDPRGYLSRGFLHFSEAIRYTIVPGDSAANATIGEATVAGEPIAGALERMFRVVFTNYLGAGGYGESWNGSPIGAGVPAGLDGYDLRALRKQDTGLVFRNEVIAQLVTLGCLGEGTGAAVDGRIRLS